MKISDKTVTMESICKGANLAISSKSLPKHNAFTISEVIGAVTGVPKEIVLDEMMRLNTLLSMAEKTETENRFKKFTRVQDRFFSWIYECSKILGVAGESLVEDPSWYWCYDDGMTPEEATEEYKEKVLKDK